MVNGVLIKGIVKILFTKQNKMEEIDWPEVLTWKTEYTIEELN